MTDVPFFQDPQFVDATGVGGLNAAFSTAVNTIADAGSGSWATPGLLAPEAMAVRPISLSLGIDLPRPWGLVSSGGLTVRAHGIQTGQDTSSYSVLFVGLVPLSGSVTAYLAATIQTIQQNTFPLTGPPQGHPSYNPNFVPTAGYAKTVYTVALAAVTGGIDNINTFELLRTTLTAGQVNISSYSTQGWLRAAARKAWPVSGVATSSVLTPAQAQAMLYPMTAGLTLTLPAVSTAGGLTYGFFNPTGGAITLATTALDRIVGFGSSALASISVPASGSVQLYGAAASGVWQTTGFSPSVYSQANYANDTGTVANIYIAALSPAPANLAALNGVPIYIKIAHTSTGASTLNINGFGAKSIVDAGGSPLIVPTTLFAGSIYSFIYDGSSFQLLTHSPTIPSLPAASNVSDSDIVEVIEGGSVAKRATAGQIRAPLLPLSGGTLAGSLAISTGDGWSSSNFGKQLLLTTPAGASNPALGVTDSNGLNLWALSNNGGALQFSIMPAYNDSISAPITRLNLSTGGATVYGIFSATSNASIGGNLAVGNNIFVSAGGISVNGNSAIAGNLGVTNGVNITAGGIAINGNSSIAGSLNMTGSGFAETELFATDGTDEARIGSYGQVILKRVGNADIFEAFSIVGGAPSSGTISGDGVGGVSYNSTSDERLKIEDGALEDAGSIIDRLKPLWFRWKHNPDNPRQPGFFAQQVAKVFSWAVTEGKGEPGDEDFSPWQMDQTKFMPMVIAELQTLRKRVKELEQRT